MASRRCAASIPALIQRRSRPFQSNPDTRAVGVTPFPFNAAKISERLPVRFQIVQLDPGLMNNLTIHLWPTAKISPYTRSPRKNDHAVDRMVAALREFGPKIPLLVRSRVEPADEISGVSAAALPRQADATTSGDPKPDVVDLVDGHLRLKAAQKLGITELPVIFCDEFTPAQVKAFRLLVNRSATWAEWDMDLLALEFEELSKLDYDLSFTGFDGPEIDNLMFRADPADEPDPLPEAPATAVSRLGDTWLCGSHRIRCGDATSAEDVGLLFATGQPVLMVSDPPYGTEYNPMWREEAGLGRQRQTGIVTNDDRADWTAAYMLFPGNVAYIWHAGVYADVVAAGLKDAGFAIRSQIIWTKPNFVLSRGDYHWQHEPCCYAVREGKPSNWCGDRKQSTVWEVENLNPVGGNRDEAATGHGTQKPIEVMRRPILNNTERGAIVYDPFLGSGTTLIAAELTERICYGLEIEPAYVDVIVRRWEQLTGKPATLESSARTFAEVQAERYDIVSSGEVDAAEEALHAAAV